VRSLLGSTIEEQADVTIVDMEAGLEHLSRSGGTLAHADVLVMVMEPSRKSIITAARTVALADDLGIPTTFGLGNKARTDDDVALFNEQCPPLGIELIGVLPHDAAVVEADRQGTVVTSGPAADALQAVVDRLLALD
jgi:CO dehydrogenase maturation factor